MNNIIYPDFYTAYQVNMPLANAAYVPEELTADLDVSYKFQQGAFRQIATLGASGTKIFRKDNESAHLLRLIFMDEKQGPFISSSRGYGNYAYELLLGKEIQLSAGLAFGFAGMSYSGISSTSQLSLFLPDMSSGLVLRYRELQIGAGAHQLLNSATKPITSKIVLKRYYQFYGQYTLEVGQDFTFQYNALYRYLPFEQDELIAGMTVFLKETAGLGFMFRSNGGISLLSQFNFDSEKDRLSLLFNYNSVFFTSLPKFQSSIELGIAYGFK